MAATNNLPNTAIILQFPVVPRLNSQRFADQARRSVELAANRKVRVAPSSGWYHDSATDEQDRSA